jgi:protein gp37
VALNTGISWAHHSQNFWAGCDKVSPECAHCYIDRILVKQGRKPWGEIYKTATWDQPLKWNQEAEKARAVERVFTCSISDFFHAKADAWRPHAWRIIKRCDHLVWLILTKRPELIESRLPPDWGEGYPNCWLGVSAGCRKSLNKMDSLRRVPVHPSAVRWISTEPLLEDISGDIDLTGFGWVITGGESGSGKEYLWDANGDWRKEFAVGGRRTMKLEWAANLRDVTKRAGLPFMFKQVTSPRSSHGVNALGRDWHEYPSPHLPYPWKPQPAIDPKHLFTPEQIADLGVENLPALGKVDGGPTDSIRSEFGAPTTERSSTLRLL